MHGVTVKKKFITVFTGVHHYCMFRVRGAQPTPSYFVSLIFILIFLSHLCQGLPSYLFPSKFSHKNYLCISNLFAPSPSYSHFITLITFADNYKFGSSLLFNFLQPVTPRPFPHFHVVLVLNILINLPFSNLLLCVIPQM